MKKPFFTSDRVDLIIAAAGAVIVAVICWCAVSGICGDIEKSALYLLLRR